MASEQPVSNMEISVFPPLYGLGKTCKWFILNFEIRHIFEITDSTDSKMQWFTRNRFKVFYQFIRAYLQGEIFFFSFHVYIRHKYRSILQGIMSVILLYLLPAYSVILKSIGSVKVITSPFFHCLFKVT